MIVLGFSGISRAELYERRYGLRFVGHDAAVALFVDGVPVFAIEEERLSRRKHTAELPVRALRAALDHAGLDLRDVNHFVYTWHVDWRRLASMFVRHPLRIPPQHWPSLAVAGARVIRDLMSPRHIRRDLERALGAPVPARCTTAVPHHATHAACAYFSSPFERAAVLTVDGQGEDESATLGEYAGTSYRPLQRIPTPDSIGILYGMITDFLGMRAAWDEYKVMGMSSYGDPDRFAGAFADLVRLRPLGRYRTRRTALVFKPGYCDRFLTETLGIPARRPDEPLEQVHYDVAAGLQRKTEEVLFHLLRRLRDLSDASALCLAGGVFQNSVANGKILASGLFEHIWVPPVPGDHGGAFGAAARIAHTRSERAVSREAGFTPFLGPEFSEAELESALTHSGARLHLERPPDIAHAAAELLADGQVVAWFQGRLEYGPRALGHRSILASPLRGEMRDVVNTRIKHRERFRPFAGAVPEEHARDYFELNGSSPHMQFVVPVRAAARERIPAVVHHGTCRAQTVAAAENPLFHELLEQFGRRTGTPVVLNTSFNDADEPMVCSPNDAVRTFLATDLDALAIGPFLARKQPPLR